MAVFTVFLFRIKMGADNVCGLEDYRFRSGPLRTPARRSFALSRGQRWLFRVLAIAIPPLFLVALEVFLRLANYGHDGSFFLSTTINGRPWLTENSRFGQRFFPAAIARTPQPVILAPRKAPGTKRIFVFGESAAMGDPEPAFGLPRMLQAMLELAFPSNRLEVINVAMTAINSHVIREIARDCAPLQGDVWVVYMGNNEVIGPFGGGTVFGRQAPSLTFIRVTLWLKRFRVVQLIASIRQPPPGRWKGLESFVEHEVMRDDPRMRKVYAQFRENLSDIVQLGTASGARVVVSTVGVNLDHPPFSSRFRSRLSSEQETAFRTALEQGIELMGRGEFQKAQEKLLEAQQIAGGTNHGYAELYYHLGRCEMALGRHEKGRVQFQLATEHDTLRFRADYTINEILRTTTSRSTGPVHFVDGAEALTGTVSNRPAHFFHEHVHLTFEGNYALARSLMSAVAPALGDGQSAARVPTLEECAQRLAWTEFNRLEVHDEMRGRMQAPPFASLFGQAERDRAVGVEMDALMKGLAADRYARPRAVYSEAIRRSPDDWVLHENFARLLEAGGDVAEAVRHWREVVRLLPHDTQAYCRIGDLLAAAGEGMRAIPFYREAIRRDPALAEARHGLALVLADKGEVAAAERELRVALQSNPELTEARLNLGKLLVRQKKLRLAEKEFAGVLLAESNNVAAHLQLGALLMQRGESVQATNHFRSALRIDPANSIARQALGPNEKP